ncbi:MAG TPA: response regulator [Steroidobacteraceae bacterium]|jgi:signal transduction histidine kinase/DNA-binding response OmpR family regulator/CHASE3 domain sensor protein|nr:response regulator [Steroidobacteraceae bacterium]
MTATSAVTDRHRGAHSSLPWPRIVLAGFVLAAVAVVLIAYFSFQSLQQRTRTADGVTHTLQVTEALQGLLSTMTGAETGERGYLLTGNETYLELYTNARAEVAGEIVDLRRLAAGNDAQQQRIDTLEQLATSKIDAMTQTIALRRAGNTDAAVAIMRAGGKATMDRIRALIVEMENIESASLATREQAWQDASRSSSEITTGGSALLLLLIAAAAVMTSRDYRARETQTWLRMGQMGLSARLQGEQRLDRLGANALEFLANYLDAQVGAVYIGEQDGRLRRFAGYGLPVHGAEEVLRPGDGLLGQAAKENRTLHMRDVPEDYLQVASSLGRGRPREIVLSPASADGSVQAVLELGFFRHVGAEERQFLERVSESLGVAVRSAKDRTRLEELLEQTQRQAEELQAQQEELRASNEEFEMQARSLSESQAQLEAQQAELEQTNAQLGQQANMLERQNDELSKAQAVLTEKTLELERTNQYKSEFLTNMSHELRTPLNSSLILAKILADNKQGNLSDEQVKYARTIDAAGNDLLALINDILDLSKIEAGKVETHLAAESVARLVDGLLKALAPVAQQKGLHLGATVEPGTPERIETDAQRLGQILKNLLANALKFTERGQVALRVFCAGDGTISFAVRDTGIGIPEHQQQVIFEAFRQADGSTHRKYGGTGLGLSISQQLARLLGGNISVQSTPGEGSVFTLTLPLNPALTVTPPLAGAGPLVRGQERPGTPARAGKGAQPRTAVATTASAAAAPAAAIVPAQVIGPGPAAIEDDREHLTPGARTVLVVEDDARFAAILRDLARELGFQCVVTHTADDALAAVAMYRPRAIVLDINLPDHSGLGVLDQLKHDSQTRHIPVYVASVADFTQEALELGAIGYALKPVKREQLVEALRQLEAKFSQGLRRVLVVEDDERQRDSIRQLLAAPEVQIVGVKTANEALEQLRATTFDCMVMDLNLPDLSGYELLERMSAQDTVAFPPVIVYTGRSLSRDAEQQLRRFSKSIIIKDARSPERLLDEVTLFLHQVEATLPPEHQRMLKVARDREAALEGRRILVVEDDARNIFALSSLLEPKGVTVAIARNGREAIEVLERSRTRASEAIDLVLMDIMMPEMDGLAATREIRTRAEWVKLPIIALTAKAMRDDQDKCLAAGANDYIAKPLDPDKLLSLVRVWLPKERLQARA